MTILLALLPLLAPSSATAQNNDECSSATALPVGSTAFDTTAATTSSDPAGCSSAFGKDVWFSYTATSTSDVTFDTCGSSFDTVLEVYVGSCGSLGYVTCNDNGCSLQSSITLTGFTPGLTVYLRVGGYNGADGTGALNVTKVIPPTGLFISEYVEGSSANKAIEVYNGTVDTVDLSGYQLLCYNNGNSSPNNTSTLSGTLAPYETAVFIPTSGNRNDIIDDLTNRGVPYGTVTAINFNGDDTVVLRTTAGVVLDVVGQVGFDPGTRWGSGSVTTRDDTLRRKSTVRVGDSDGTDSFAPADEFDGFAKDDFSDLGSHTGPIDVRVVCDVTSNSDGTRATLVASGSRAVSDNDLELTVAGLPTSGTTAYIYNTFLSAGQSLVTVHNPTPGGGPAAGGDVCIAGGTFGRHLFGSDLYMGTSGTFSIDVDLTDVPSPRDGISWPNPGHYSTTVLVGETWYWQCWYRDQAAGVGASNFTEAIGITFQ